MNYIGVDPGKSGAIAIVDSDGGVVNFIKGSETERDISDWLAHETEEVVAGVIEKVHAMPKQGVTSSFKFGYSFGFLSGMLIAHRVPFELVSPLKWQTAMSCRTGGDKNVSKAAAQRLWPSIKITHATADALLLAEYCRRMKRYGEQEGKP